MNYFKLASIRPFLLFILTILTWNLCAQEDEGKIKYKGEGIYFEYINTETGEIENRIPYGKSPIVTYDSFFKGYEVIFTQENGRPAKWILRFLSKEEDYIRMIDNHDSVFYVTNFIKKNQTLVLLQDKIVNGLYTQTE